jgi:hypothetical protein
MTEVVAAIEEAQSKLARSAPKQLKKPPKKPVIDAA